MSITRNGEPQPSIAAALNGALPGDVVELAAGHYGPGGERFPLVVGSGVTLRATPAARGGAVVVDARTMPAVALTGDHPRLLGVTIHSRACGPSNTTPTGVTVSEAAGAEIRDCHVHGILISAGDQHHVIGNVVAGGNIQILDATSSTIANNYVHGHRGGAGIEVRGGRGHLVESNECRDDLCAIHVAGSEEVRVARNRFDTLWFGICVDTSNHVVVRSNKAWRTIWAVRVRGGERTFVGRNLAEHCDTGVLVEREATGTEVTDNWLHDCRVGVRCSDDRGTVVAENAISAPREHAIVMSGRVDLRDNDLGGGDVWQVP